MDFTFRPATESDRTYLQRLNYLTEVFGDESAELTPESLAGVKAYVDDWDPHSDGGVIAFDTYRTPAGGVWLRYWSHPDDGLANLGRDIPELAIAVENRFAGNRLAVQLLDAACALARSQGAPRIALWVDPNNPRARHRYERYGFVDAEPADAMVLDL